MTICAGGSAHQGNILAGLSILPPAVSMEQFDRGFDTLQMFARLEGINGDTIVRGFCNQPEIRLGEILPASLKEDV